MHVPIDREALRRAGHVMIWRASLAVSDDAIERMRSLLSDDERDRAARFRVRAARNQSIAARAILRQILGVCLEVDPGQLHFEYGPHGKPSLANTAGDPLQFSLSHSGDCLLVAVGRERAVGVDVEQVRPLPEMEAMVARFLGPLEQAAVRAAAGAGRTEAFFRCWTRKEALLKAWGTGLAEDLAGLDVDSIGFSTEAIAVFPYSSPEGSVWSIRDVEVPGGYCGAVAVEGRDAVVCVADWPAA